MAFIAWFSLIIYTLSAAISDAQLFPEQGLFLKLVTLAIQICIITCLGYLAFTL